MSPAIIARRLIQRDGRESARRRMAMRLRFWRYAASETPRHHHDRLDYIGTRILFWSVALVAARRVAA